MNFTSAGMVARKKRTINFLLPMNALCALIALCSCATTRSQIHFPQAANTQKPKCLDEKGYCTDEHVPGYPDRLTINRAFQQTRLEKPYDAPDELLNRLGGHNLERFGESPLCQAQRSVIYPRLGLAHGTDPVYIPNNEDVKQRVDIELCMFPEEECLLGKGTKCKQMYSSYRFIVLKDGNLTTELIRLPSSCTCFAKNELIASRFCSTPNCMRPENPEQSLDQRPSTPTVTVRRSQGASTRGRRESESSATASSSEAAAAGGQQAGDQLQQLPSVGGFAGEVQVNSNAIQVQSSPPLQVVTPN